jgi:hypothetical protein
MAAYKADPFEKKVDLGIGIVLGVGGKNDGS